ncbi:MAG: tetratricopeptide repeat protein [Phormidesmis sp.]
MTGSIEQLLEKLGRPQAVERAVALFEKARAKGAVAYREADYDLALAHDMLGTILFKGGQAEPALGLFVEAQRLFEELGERGDRMESVTLTEQADCLRVMGQLDKAAEKYEENIQRAEKLEDFRQVGVGKGQLATTQMLQGKHEEAIAGFEAAKHLFAQQNEPASVATALHQLGVVYEEAGQYEPAEEAYRRALEITTQLGNLSGQTSSLGQLGNLYISCLSRPEEAVTFYRQAADKYVAQQDLQKEGVVRNNIENTLCKLRCYDDARPEILRAIECDKPFGHAAQPWKTFAILH